MASTGDKVGGIFESQHQQVLSIRIPFFCNIGNLYHAWVFLFPFFKEYDVFGVRDRGFLNIWFSGVLVPISRGTEKLSVISQV